MDKREQEIKDRVKKEVKSFDAWYFKNEVRLIKADTSSRYKKEQEALKKYRIRQGKRVACLNFVLIVAILSVVFYLPKRLNNKFNLEDTLLIVPEEVQNKVDYEVYFYDKLITAYNDTMHKYMGLTIPFEKVKSFATKIDDESLILLGAIVEKKIDGEKSFLTYRFSSNAIKDFEDYDDYKDLKDNLTVGNYNLFYNKGEMRDNYYFYKVRMERANDNAVCYMEIKTKIDDVDRVLTVLF